ncbi:diaminopimelate epimerase [Mangrovimonas aestuarii]|uniref:diaminopimelate epimerase n=1 Tax=Mangrovimonas aestuarii TaxID=3018443 RepID=UPI00237933E6|nr:diaminopimelate epimerase [Mangrovimonas aestuarii]
MKYTFYKYQGTGNDFVMIDNRHNDFDKNNTKLVNLLCDRRFGIGADGLILIEDHDATDFKMVYYNSDGNQSTMCGNGGRCISAFARDLGVINGDATFEAVDGLHHVKFNGDEVSLQMQDVSTIENHEEHLFLDTGSPHHVELRSDLDALDVKEVGAGIRYGELYGKEGSNVNFVEQIGDSTFNVRTYERGVEDETFSCGTGVTAVAIAMFELGKTKSNNVTLKTKGGDLKVSFVKTDEGYKDVWLTGPAKRVFKGEVSC